MSGAKQATLVVATDVRETSATVTEHREGAQAADQTRAKVKNTDVCVLGCMCVHMHIL